MIDPLKIIKVLYIVQWCLLLGALRLLYLSVISGELTSIILAVVCVVYTVYNIITHFDNIK